MLACIDGPRHRPCQHATTNHFEREWRFVVRSVYFEPKLWLEIAQGAGARRSVLDHRMHESTWASYTAKLAVSRHTSSQSIRPLHRRSSQTSVYNDRYQSPIQTPSLCHISLESSTKSPPVNVSLEQASYSDCFLLLPPPPPSLWVLRFLPSLRQ